MPARLGQHHSASSLALPRCPRATLHPSMLPLALGSLHAVAFFCKIKRNPVSCARLQKRRPRHAEACCAAPIHHGSYVGQGAFAMRMHAVTGYAGHQYSSQHALRDGLLRRMRGGGEWLGAELYIPPGLEAL